MNSLQGEEYTANEINNEIAFEASEDLADCLARQRQKEECHFRLDF